VKAVKLKPAQLHPAFIAAGVIALVCLLRVLNLDFIERLERMTYDVRVRAATHFPSSTATNLGCVFVGDEDIKAVNDGLLEGDSYGLYWPRHIYARAYRELTAEGARAVGYDVLFAEARPDQGTVRVSTSQWPEVTNALATIEPLKSITTFPSGTEVMAIVDSDDFFAWQLHRGGTGIIAAKNGAFPIPLLATNAQTVADIQADSDSDGVLRRVKAFRNYRHWHRIFQQAATDYGVELDRARIEPGKVILPLGTNKPIEVKIDAQTNFDLTDFVGDKLPPGMPRYDKAVTEERVWHMGIVLAARELGFDLRNAEVDLPHGRITLRGAGRIARVIPVDADGYFYINWELTTDDRRLMSERIEGVLVQDRIRNGLMPGELTNQWAGKLVIIGSNAQGNDLTDRGATPLEKDACLVAKHWNVANSIITGRFVQRTPLADDLLLIVGLGAATALLTLRLRVVHASGAVILLLLTYWVVASWAYVQFRYWLPVIIPVAGAMLVQHVCLVTWRVLFEQAERRRVRSIFSRIVSPHVVNELLEAEKLALGGTRKEVTVLFADVRGFTEFTDVSQEKAAAYVQEQKLTGEAVEVFYNEHARETLNTVNTYLSLVADQVLKHDGTLDKYIGDCVMAFWGAPIGNPKQAVACVRAAVDAQRAVYELNRSRALENRKLELENMARIAGGQTPLPLMPVLMLGTGINTGMATAGLMGSEKHQFNYTVFGREVNLASRLESLSGRGRVLISEATHQCLLRDDPELAATCRSLPAEKVKGIRTAVKIFEVPWRLPGTLPFDEEFSGGTTVEPASTTSFVQRSTA
jgi:class 3 adenylate cyclase/CHASE2 domain-containing sensor protein